MDRVATGLTWRPEDAQARTPGFEDPKNHQRLLVIPIHWREQLQTVDHLFAFVLEPKLNALTSADAELPRLERRGIDQCGLDQGQGRPCFLPIGGWDGGGGR